MSQVVFDVKTNRQSNYYGISALVVAALLLLAIGNWPYEYYRILRIATFFLSVSIVYRNWGGCVTGWLVFGAIGAFLFNPILPISMNRASWSNFDLIFAIGYCIYGIRSLSNKAAKIAYLTIVVVFLLESCLVFYVNHYMPHGPSFATGEVVCANDDRGPCGSEYVEDTSNLSIPNWAKFLRQGSLVLNLSLVLSGLYCYVISKRHDGDSNDFER